MRENTFEGLDLGVEQIAIFRWMGEGLRLRGNALVVYALIFNATMKGTGWKEPLGKMRAWTATKSMTPILSAVSSMVLAGLVTRSANGTLKADKRCAARAIRALEIRKVLANERTRHTD